MLDLSNNFTFDDLRSEVDGAIGEIRDRLDRALDFATMSSFDVGDIEASVRDIEDATETRTLAGIAEAMQLIDAIEGHPDYAAIRREGTVIFPEDDADNFARAIAAKQFPDIDWNRWPFDQIDWFEAAERANLLAIGVARTARITTDDGESYTALLADH